MQVELFANWMSILKQTGYDSFTEQGIDTEIEVVLCFNFEKIE